MKTYRLGAAGLSAFRRTAVYPRPLPTGFGAQWTCHQCLRREISLPLRSQFSRPTFNYATQASPVTAAAGQAQSSKRGSRKIVYAVIGGSLAVVSVLYLDKLQHAVAAAQRSGRVLGELAVCIDE